MKIVKFYGGLGNQMFQYAMLIAIRETTGNCVLMDTSLYSTYSLHNGFELEKIFNITAKRANKDQIKQMAWYTENYRLSRFIHYCLPARKHEFKEKEYGKFYPEALTVADDVIYDGYWQHWEYFNMFRELIIRELSLKDELDDNNGKTLDALKSSNNCSVHVRRGDYLKSKHYKNTCSKEYYRNAIQMVKERGGDDVHFYFFSNDFQWCIDNLSDLVDNEHFHRIDWNNGSDSYKDMVLMSGCKYNIIANSSFSWWGAYLNQREDNLVIAPQIWINKKITNPIPMKEWIKV